MRALYLQALLVLAMVGLAACGLDSPKLLDDEQLIEARQKFLGNPTVSQSGGKVGLRSPGSQPWLPAIIPPISMGGSADLDPEGPCKTEIATYCAHAAKRSRAQREAGAAEATVRRELLQVKKPTKPVIVKTALQDLLKKYNASAIGKAGSPVAKCLKGVIAAQRAAISQSGPPITDACKRDVRVFFEIKAQDIRNDYFLMMTCSVEIMEFCDKVVPGDGRVISCLKTHKPSLSEKCSRTVSRRQIDSAEDISLDGKLKVACANDLAKHCKLIGWGDGKGKACLEAVNKKQPTLLEPVCKAAMYRRALEDSEDIRFDFKLASTCAVDKRKFCPDTPPGKARVIHCLESHKDDVEFTAGCRKMLEARILRKSKDIRLDYRFRMLCRDDVKQLCPPFETLVTKPWVRSQLRGHDLMECMRDHASKISSPKCKDHIYHLKTRGAANAQLDSPLQRNCAAEIKELCSDVTPSQSHLLMSCLSRKKQEGYIVSQMCGNVLLKRMTDAYSDFNLNPVLRVNCRKEYNKYCKKIALPAHADESTSTEGVSQCLVSHKHELDFTDKCKSALDEFNMDSLGDIRMVRDVHDGCQSEVRTLCGTIEPGEGRVINCLQQKRSMIASAKCRSAVLRITGLAADDWRMDFNLYTSCRQDVKTYCAGIEPGEGRVHKCLRANEERISPRCRMMERKLEEMEMEDIRLNPRLKVCSAAVRKFCKDVPPGGSARIACLQDHMGENDFPVECYNAMEEIIEKSSTRFYLNPRVKQMCDEDVNRFCRWSEMGSDDPDGHILSCLSKHVDLTQDECRREIVRTVRLQLWRYKEGVPLTSTCDEDAARFCEAHSSAGKFLQSGYVAECLMRHAGDVSRACWSLVSLPDAANVRSAADLEAKYWQQEFVDKAVQEAAQSMHSKVEGALKRHVERHVEHHVEQAFSKQGSTWLLPAAVIAVAMVVLGAAGYYAYSTSGASKGPWVVKDVKDGNA